MTTRMAIRLADPVAPEPGAPPRIRRLVVARSNPTVRVYATDSAMRQVWHAVKIDGELVERGGALAGRYGVDPAGRRFVVITDVLPAPDAPASRTHIEIRPQDWIDIYERLARLPGARLLGWYHSHPGLGLSLSFTDRETQRRVFDIDWQVALVVDPCRRRFRFYLGGEARRAPWVAIATLDGRRGSRGLEHGGS